MISTTTLKDIRTEKVKGKVKHRAANTQKVVLVSSTTAAVQRSKLILAQGVFNCATSTQSTKEELGRHKDPEGKQEDIKILKREIHLREVAITELRRRLELDQKQKDEIELTIENFENSSKSLSKLIDCQIVDKCKTSLGYNVVPPPYTGKFMPPKPDLSFYGLEEFMNEPIVSEPTVKKPIVETSEDICVKTHIHFISK
ncbi:hypothetical protein Tco_0080284 [Tanacetum coccineum]